MIIFKRSNIFLSSSKVGISRSIPWVLKTWFYLLAFWALSLTRFTEILRGFRIGHQFYYIEFLFLPAIILLFLKPKKIKFPMVILFLGFWLLIMAGVGYLKGYFPSLIYDRGRNWAAMIILLLLLYRYKISFQELIRLLKPVFIAAVIGYPLTMAFPPVDYHGLIHIHDTLGFNFMFAAFAVGDFWIKRRLYWWHLMALCTAFAVPVFLAARAKFLAMVMGLVTPILRDVKKSLLQSIILFILIISIIGSIIFFVTPAEQSANKSLRGEGFRINSLEHTSNARFREKTALTDQMKDLEYLFGKGAGATWDGSEIYLSSIGTERQNFHIYYFEIFYLYGLVGIVLWFSVGIIPVMKGYLHLKELNTVGIMGLCSQIAILFSWLGHAGYSINEGSYIAIALYAIYCGRKKTNKNARRSFYSLVIKRKKYVFKFRKNNCFTKVEFNKLFRM